MTDKKDLKNKYQADIQVVRRLVNQFDPCGFVSYCGDEEYDDMNNQILSYFYDNKTRQQIRDMILDKIQNYYEKNADYNKLIIFIEGIIKSLEFFNKKKCISHVL